MDYVVTERATSWADPCVATAPYLLPTRYYPLIATVAIELLEGNQTVTKRHGTGDPSEGEGREQRWPIRASPYVSRVLVFVKRTTSMKSSLISALYFVNN